MNNLRVKKNDSHQSFYINIIKIDKYEWILSVNEVMASEII